MSNKHQCNDPFKYVKRCNFSYSSEFDLLLKTYLDNSFSFGGYLSITYPLKHIEFGYVGNEDWQGIGILTDAFYCNGINEDYVEFVLLTVDLENNKKRNIRFIAENAIINCASKKEIEKFERTLEKVNLELVKAKLDRKTRVSKTREALKKLRSSGKSIGVSRTIEYREAKRGSAYYEGGGGNEWSDPSDCPGSDYC